MTRKELICIKGKCFPGLILWIKDLKFTKNFHITISLSWSKVNSYNLCDNQACTRLKPFYFSIKYKSLIKITTKVLIPIKLFRDIVAIIFG